MHRSDASGSEVKTHSVGDSINKISSKKLETDTYSDQNSRSTSELSELANHTFLVKERASSLIRELNQNPESDNYILLSETV